MAMKFSKKPSNNKPPSLEKIIESQQADIKKLKEEKLELQLSMAEMFEQSQVDKMELQLAIVELAEEILEQNS